MTTRSTQHDVETGHRHALAGLLALTFAGLAAETFLRTTGNLVAPWSAVLFGTFATIGIGGALLLGLTWRTPWREGTVLEELVDEVPGVDADDLPGVLVPEHAEAGETVPASRDERGPVGA